MSVITFINEEGGIGKTSVCFNVAWELSKRGSKILMIDMDGQKANLSFFAGINKDSELFTVLDVFKKNLDIQETIKPVKENLDIVPADSGVSNLDMSAKVSKFKKAIESVRDSYEHIFINCAHFLNSLIRIMDVEEVDRYRVQIRRTKA